MLLRFTTCLMLFARRADSKLLATSNCEARQLVVCQFGGIIVYTTSAPLKAVVRNVASLKLPTNAFAPRLPISFTRSLLLVITLTSLPLFTRPLMMGLLIWPTDPEITYFFIETFLFELMLQFYA